MSVGTRRNTIARASRRERSISSSIMRESCSPRRLEICTASRRWVASFS